MVKMTIVGRASDGLPLSQGPRYVNEADDDHDFSFSSYKEQAEFILNEVAKSGPLSPSKMSIRVDRHFFQIKNQSHHLNVKNYGDIFVDSGLCRSHLVQNVSDFEVRIFMIDNGVCCITLCDSTYPTRLAFNYLEDLHKEMDKFGTSFIYKISKPYSFIKFDGVIGNIRKRYIDTRTQSNLSKLKAHHRQDPDILIENMSNILEKRRKLDMFEKVMTAPKVSAIWCSPLLEVIALKWTPITLVAIVVTVLLWTCCFSSYNFS